MLATVISDTHSWNSTINVPKSDLLIHSGDLTRIGSKSEITQALTWLSSLPHKYKVVIAGNHDFFLDSQWQGRTDIGQSRHSHRAKGTEEEIKELLSQFKDIIYLNDSGTEIEGIKIWGSPIQPWFHDWAFNRNRGEEILKHWKLIPKDIDILITHGPPFGILDRTVHGDYTGCSDLLKEIETRKIKLHIFGHIHEGRGTSTRTSDDGTHQTIFLNASSIDETYEPFPNPYTMVDLEKWEILNGKR